MKNWIKILLTISSKDLIVELKSKETIVTITLFSLLVVSIFAVTSSNPSNLSAEIGAGLSLWPCARVWGMGFAWSSFVSQETMLTAVLSHSYFQHFV